MPEILTTSSRTAINRLLRFFLCSFVSFVLFFVFFLFPFIMIHCKYYSEILFYATFVFIKEKKKSMNKNNVTPSLFIELAKVQLPKE